MEVTTLEIDDAGPNAGLDRRQLGQTPDNPFTRVPADLAVVRADELGEIRSQHAAIQHNDGNPLPEVPTIARLGVVGCNPKGHHRQDASFSRQNLRFDALHMVRNSAQRRNIDFVF